MEFPIRSLMAMSEHYKTYVFDVVDERGKFRKEEVISPTESHAHDTLIANNLVSETDKVLNITVLEE